jgi:4-hydroxybutyrate dehydrogenase/sulfolactaldehyde 3-reductase
MTRVAFIGLGTMGEPMARNVLKGGHALAVFDVHRRAVDKFAGTPARLATTPADAAEGAEVVVTMLPTSADVDAALLGPDGAAQRMAPGSLLIDCTTAAPHRSVALARQLADRKIRMIDAPVGRPPWDAQAGTLMFMVGGTEDDIAAAQPVLGCMGNEVIRCGPQGSGATVKVINNYMSVSGMVLAAETLAFGRKAGLDRDVLMKVLQSTVAGRGAINVLYPKKVLSGDLTPLFAMRLAHKDLGLALELGGRLGVPLGMGAAGREELGLGQAWGRMEEDVTAILLVLEDIAKATA